MVYDLFQAIKPENENCCQVLIFISFLKSDVSFRNCNELLKVTQFKWLSFLRTARLVNVLFPSFVYNSSTLVQPAFRFVSVEAILSYVPVSFY